MPRAAPIFGQPLPISRLGGAGRIGLFFDIGMASAQPGRAPVASGEEEADLRDRIRRRRRAGDGAGDPQPPSPAAATATACTLRRRSCACTRFGDRLCHRLGTWAPGQLVECRGCLQPQCQWRLQPRLQPRRQGRHHRPEAQAPLARASRRAPECRKLAPGGDLVTCFVCAEGACCGCLRRQRRSPKGLAVSRPSAR